MPIGQVYRPPPRKRSSSGLGATSNEAGNSAVSPTSPSLPTGRAQSDLEARIAEFSINNTQAPGSPGGRVPSELRVTSPVASALPSSAASGALPPKSPTLLHNSTTRQSAPPRTGSSTSQSDQMQSLSTPASGAELPDSHYSEATAERSTAVHSHAQHSRSTVPTQQTGTSYSAADSARPVSQTTDSAHHQELAENGVGVTGAKILIIYYSMYGHVRLLADSVRQGVESVPGCTAEIYRVPETLSPDVLKKMNAPPKHNDPELTHDMLHKLAEADGIMFGIPTRFGMMSAQMKAFFDSTVKLWTKGDLVGKPAATFFSTATQGGGQETTALTTITQLVHHGMIYVPPGYSFGGAMFSLHEVHGGSPYGCGTIANGDGSRLPSKYELDYARHQGASFAAVAMKLAQ